jgi:perosamine synthetase
MINHYRSLSDPSGLVPKSTEIIWPAEPPLGGWYTENELQDVVNVIKESMDWRVGFKAQDTITDLEEAICCKVGCRHAIVLNGAGTALDLLLKTLEIQPGDEVISCSLNFHGTHLAILGAGANLILAEPEFETLDVSIDDVETLLNNRTRAVLVTSLHGQIQNLSRLQELLNSRPNSERGPVRIIVDAARCLGATNDYEPVGKTGWAFVYSLQSKKIISALGEGGIVVTNDEQLSRKLREYRSFGLGRAWGSNYKMTKVQAKVAMVQLENLEEKVSKRLLVAQEFKEKLCRCSELILPKEREGYKHTFAFYPIMLGESWNRKRRDALMAKMAINHRVGSVVANPPTYLYNSWIRKRIKSRTPVAEKISDKLFCPSFHPLMKLEDINYISEAILTSVGEV